MISAQQAKASIEVEIAQGTNDPMRTVDQIIDSAWGAGTAVQLRANGMLKLAAGTPATAANLKAASAAIGGGGSSSSTLLIVAGAALVGYLLFVRK